MKVKPIGLYVHIPFCVRKCNYCDFCSYDSLSRGMRAGYITALKKEIESYKKSDKILVDTIFFGGGTPSLLDPDEFDSIMDSIENTFEISSDVEFTVEVNPGTLSDEKIFAFVRRGVNRISMGLQSVHENEQKNLGRIHNYEDFLKAYSMIRNAGIANFNVDLMYGIPGQTIESFKKTLSSVADLCPTHISCYGLMLEEGTRFWDIKDDLDLPCEDDEVAMYEAASRILSDVGYSHYEISNYARPGYESRHNLKYWKCHEYIGVGASAYSYLDGKRFGNPSDINEYLSAGVKEYITEEADPEYEFVMLGLRLREGISLAEYRDRFGKDFIFERKNVIDPYIDGGYVIHSGDRLSLSEKGFYISNTILTDLL